VRILIVDTCYSAFLADHYARRPELSGATYDEQWRALMATGFGTSDAYSHNLAALGHEAHEVIANCVPLQAAWAREHGLRRPRWGARRAQWDEAVLLEQATAFRPDVVYFQDLHYVSTAAMETLRGGGALLAGQIASEAPPDERLRAFDLLLTSFPHYVERFRRLGVSAEYFRIGFDERLLDRLEAEPRESVGAVFAGALNRAQHRAGNELLERAARRVPIDFWGYDASGWGADSPIVTRYHGEAWGLEMYKVLRRARIAINRHIGVAAGYANNMRLFEATGVGTLLLTDRGSNLAELFEPGAEVAVYSGEDDLVTQTRHYLEADDERREIARAGQKRTLRDHTYAHRMAELVPILMRALGRPL
jgi:spore maturation protein CgeB